MLKEQISTTKGIYFGDISYALSKKDYDDFFDIYYQKNNLSYGKYTLNDKSLIIHGTYKGDGLYLLKKIIPKSRFNVTVAVDSGNLGIVDLNLVDKFSRNLDLGFLIEKSGTYVLEVDDKCTFKIICLNSNEVWICNTKPLKNKYD